MTRNEQPGESRPLSLQDLGHDQEQYSLLVEEVRQFRETRSRLIDEAALLLEQWNALDRENQVGKPPFVISDAESFFAYMDGKGEVAALPFGFELAKAHVDLSVGLTLFSTRGVDGDTTNYLVSVNKAFAVPDEDAFAVEHLLVNELSKFEFDGLTVRNDIYRDAESGERYTGHAVLRWPDGSLRKEADFIDGMFDDKMTWWYENGQKELEDHYVENLRHGTHRAWHENGQLMAQGESTHGQRQGSWLWWHDNGRLAEETVYEDNQPLTKKTFWHDNGAKKLETSYQDGLEHGTQKTWFENGQRNTEFELENGEGNGVLTVWSESGVKSAEIHVVDGRKHGLETKWDDDGSLICERNWIHGEEDE